MTCKILTIGGEQEGSAGVLLARYRGITVAAHGDLERLHAFFQPAAPSDTNWRSVFGDVSYLDWRRIMLDFYDRPESWLADKGGRIFSMAPDDPQGLTGKALDDTRHRPLTEIHVAVGGPIDPLPVPHKRSVGYLILRG